MKEKTSITLSSDLLAKMDRQIGTKTSRSAFIEQVLRAWFEAQYRRRIHDHDLVRINAAADQLKREVEDVLDYQTPLW